MANVRLVLELDAETRSGFAHKRYDGAGGPCFNEEFEMTDSRWLVLMVLVFGWQGLMGHHTARAQARAQDLGRPAATQPAAEVQGKADDFHITLDYLRLSSLAEYDKNQNFKPVRGRYWLFRLKVEHVLGVLPRVIQGLDNLNLQTDLNDPMDFRYGRSESYRLYDWGQPKATSGKPITSLSVSGNARSGHRPYTKLTSMTGSLRVVYASGEPKTATFALTQANLNQPLDVANVPGMKMTLSRKPVDKAHEKLTIQVNVGLGIHVARVGFFTEKGKLIQYGGGTIGRLGRVMSNRRKMGDNGVFILPVNQCQIIKLDVYPKLVARVFPFEFKDVPLFYHPRKDR